MWGSSSLARAEAGRRRGTRELGAVAGLVVGAWRPDAGLLVAVAGAPRRRRGWRPVTGGRRVWTPPAGGGCVREATGSWEGSAQKNGMMVSWAGPYLIMG